eukprot:SAG31_NODE_35296_length_324_cov_1.142222_1_plen_24_part_01
MKIVATITLITNRQANRPKALVAL